jgi:biopolymer transport protein ExbD
MPGMRRFPDTPSKKTRIEIIPMIDVMMFLLVFFVLISINVIPALGHKTKLPVSSTATEDRPLEKVIVTLSKNQEIQVDGKTLQSLDEVKQLMQTIKQHAKGRLSVIVNGDESVSLQRLVDVMDVLKSVGIDAMTIAAKKK